MNMSAGMRKVQEFEQSGPAMSLGSAFTALSALDYSTDLGC